MSKKIILVVGGAGYIGSHMVRTLNDAKYKTLIFDNLSTGHKELIPKGTIFVKGDLCRRNDIQKMFTDYRIDTVMHFAASSIVPESVKNPLLYYENNVTACVNLLKVMRENSVKKFIFSSTAAVYGEPTSIPIKEKDETATFVSLAFIEVQHESSNIEDYAEAWGREQLPFDYVWFTPRGSRDDQCEVIKQHMKKKQQGISQSK